MPAKWSRVESVRAKPVKPNLPAAALSAAAKNESIEIRCHALMKAKDKAIAAADRLRKIQLKNINDMHDFDVDEANAKYKAAVDELRQTNSSSPTPAVSSPPRGTTAKTSNSVAPARSTRSKQRDNEDEDDTADKNNDKSTAASSTVTSASSNKKQKVANATFQLTGKTLCSADCRADFALIMEDARSRTAALPAAPTQVNVTVKQQAEGNTLTIDYPNTDKPGKHNTLTSVFSVGIPVCVACSVTDEVFKGVICVITRTEIVLKLSCGSRVRFFIAQLRSERLKMKFKL